MDKIILPEIKIMACHGIAEWEKITPQPFLISIEAGIDLNPAAVSGNITDTMHYGELYKKIYKLATENHFDLIETLALHIAEMVLLDGLVQQVKVRVEKSQAKFEEYKFPAIVEITRSKV